MNLINNILYKSLSEIEKENKLYDDIMNKGYILEERLENIKEEIYYIEADLNSCYDKYPYQEEFRIEKKEKLKELKKEKKQLEKKIRTQEKRYIKWHIKWFASRGNDFKDKHIFWVKKLKEFNEM